MEKLKKKPINKKVLAVLVLMIVMTAFMLFLRGPYVSNVLKMAVLSKVSEMTGMQFIAQRIYINLLPFYIEAKDVRAFDKDGKRLLSISRVKTYLVLSHLLQKKITLDRIVFIRPEVRATKSVVDEVIANISLDAEKPLKPGGGEAQPFQVDIRSVIVKRGSLDFVHRKQDYSLSISGADAEVLLKENPEIRFSAGSVVPVSEGWPRIHAEIEGNALFTGDAVEVRSLTIKQDGSSIHGIGVYGLNRQADFTVDMLLDIDTVKEALSLERTGEGTLFARGSLSLRGDLKNPRLDMSVWGDLYLETLIEAIGLRDYPHPLSGHIDVNGTLEGPVRELNGQGSAQMQVANIYGVEVDSLKGKVRLEDSVLQLYEIEGRLYGGAAQADVSLPLPRPVNYSVDVKYQEAASAAVLKLARITWLDIPEGVVSGTFKTAGPGFNPSGKARYVAKQAEEGPLGMVRTIQGEFNIEDNVLNLKEFQVQSTSSLLEFDGSLELDTKEMSFAGNVNSSDISEIVKPYITGIKGSGNVKVVVSGSLEAPSAQANLTLKDVSVRGYVLGDVRSKLGYERDSLILSSVVAEKDEREHEARGTITFPINNSIPDLKNGSYDLSATVRNGGLRELLKALGFDVDVKAQLDTELSIKGGGRTPVIAGKASLDKITAYDRAISTAKLSYKYDSDTFTIQDAVASEGEAVLRFSGFVSRNGNFKYKMTSERLDSTLLAGKEIPVQYDISINSSGQGTFQEPNVDLTISLRDGKFLQQDIGGGRVDASLKGRSLQVNGNLAKEKLKFKGEAIFEGDIPWSASLDIEHGRYDFLIGAFLKRIPDDLMLNMHGTMAASGTKDTINASIVMDRLNLNMFGQGFRSRNDIQIEVENSNIKFSRVALQSGSTYLETGGSIALGTSYDVTFEGSSALSPLSGIIEGLEGAQGELDFVFSIAGSWNNPIINGGLSLDDAGFTLKGFPQRLSHVNAYAYFDKGKAVISNMSAHLGGGKISSSGAVYFDGLNMERFYLDTVIKDVTLLPTSEFNINLGGNVLLRGTKSSQALSGEIRINRARYTKRIEWKKRLYGFRPGLAPKGSEGVGGLALNLRVYGDRNIMIDNNIAQASLRADVIVKGTLSSPRLYGRIETEEGKVYFKNNEFRIISATADYADDPTTSPYVRVYSETFSQGYHVWLSVEGKDDKYDLVLTSDPPLEDVAILGLLTVGETGGGSEGIEGGIGAAEATSFLTGELQDVAEERMRSIAGFDRVQIDPYVSKTTGAVTPKVTVTKKLVGDQLAVTYSKSVGTEEQEVKLEYILSNNVSLLGGQDERGSLGADVKFRFRFK